MPVTANRGPKDPGGNVRFTRLLSRLLGSLKSHEVFASRVKMSLSDSGRFQTLIVFCCPT
jgi:hypothetical protein